MSKDIKKLSSNEMRAIKDSRRDFLRAIFRYSTLGVLGTLGVVLTARKNSNNTECINVPSCNECRLFNNCFLPPAMRARNS
ncbi:MAG: hypothetical protein ACP5T0_09025 [Verrucomicrobiia bacterium]